MGRLDRTKQAEIRRTVREEVSAFFSSADGIAVVSLALSALMDAAQNGATILGGKQPEEVIAPLDALDDESGEDDNEPGGKQPEKKTKA